MEAVTCTVWADRPMLASLNLRERWWQYMLVHVLRPSVQQWEGITVTALEAMRYFAIFCPP